MNSNILNREEPWFDETEGWFLEDRDIMTPQQFSEPTIEDFTCNTCHHWLYCEYAFDWYNTHGDCLQLK